MKKADKAKRDPDMLAEYDFSQGVRGKYAQRYSRGHVPCCAFARCCGVLSRLRGSECRAAGLDSDRPQDHEKGGPLRRGAGRELSEIEQLVEQHRLGLLEAWNEYLG